MTPRYLSIYPEGTSIEEAYADALEKAFLATFGQNLTQEAFGGSWEKNEKSRSPYTDAWKLAGGTITLFAAPQLSHCCVEISGKGCEALLSVNKLNRVLACIADRVVRIDIACDIETEVKPEEFVSTTSHIRMRASGYQKSSTGETSYVGSQKSDRFARVYRFYPPHPRADLLRVEHVFRRDYAKTVAQACLDADIDSIAKAAGVAFGWAHGVWQTDSGEMVDISVISANRETGKTVHWLINSCAASFKRLVETGEISDAEAFLNRYFLSAD